MPRYLSGNINPFNASDRYTVADNEALFCHGNPGAVKTYTTSLVIYPLRGRVRGPNPAVACFYFDFAFRKEQTPTSVPGSLLKQIIGRLKIPEEIVEAFRDRKRVTDGREPRPPEIAKMFQTISALQRTLNKCIDALDEQLPDSLREIVLKPPETRIFRTGRLHILDEIEKRLAGRAAFPSLKASKDDIIRYVRVILNMDTTPKAVDSNLELDILRNISKAISEMFLLDSLKVEAILQDATTYRKRLSWVSFAAAAGSGYTLPCPGS